ncbi:hypothetical protein A8709_08585 [Paenibacillus pectinilyticus]|uniref:HTH araC/xylS-type domain-containing protein n=1 Tax=Paenibacillus pectinilyticus TaxID=512399 RepID=A0A1C1A7Y0_9BACL|nr:helix-turn-helix domain-containing protein [Paenibacillus pectinilyticus]OCT16714.1 hypothetical protein A8709_08585 [Paenibacillus pectinilyticus]
MKRTIEDEELQLIGKLLHDNLQLPVHLLNSDRTVEILFNSGHDIPRHPLDPNSDLVREGIFSDESPFEIPCYATWNAFDQYIWLRFDETSGQSRAIVIGPATSSMVTTEMLEGFLYDYAISGVHLEPLLDYYRQLPVRYTKSMLLAGTLLYYLIFRLPLDLTEVIDRNVSFRQPPALNDEVVRDLLDKRLNLNTHNHWDTDKMLLQCVKEGRKEELARYLPFIQKETVGVLSRRSRIRSEKNLAICTVTYATMAAIEGGMYPEAALTVSDLWIQHIEDLNDAEEVFKVAQEVLFDFADRVSRQGLSRRSKPVAVCQNYIFNRIYEPIRLAELAEAAGVHPSHLTKLFKQETGITISEYIQRQKVEEAKKLLAFSDATPFSAASLLNFHDQSHFTKVFKKYAGVTPKQYKKHAV